MLVSTTETTYGYVYDGGQLRQMTITTTVTTDEETTTQTETLSFTYDASGAPQTVTCGENTYLYVTNIQGDVVAILDDTGNPVVEYTYDAWGKLLSTSSSVEDRPVAFNPLRYRGYVYDTETELYYLQSRYYDPEICRFINADSYTSTGQGLLGNNMFAYCGNNPVGRADFAGHAFVQMAYDNGNHLSLLCPALGGGGGGGGGSYAFAGAGSVSTIVTRIKNIIYNSNEEITHSQLETYGVGFYKGTMVVRVDVLGDSCASFGIILMGGENIGQRDFNETLNHEYGHVIHFKQIGGHDYLNTTVVPSLIGAAIASNSRPVYDMYYNLPWERVADYLGGVNSGYSPGANTAGVLFWIYSIVVSLITP